MDLLSALITVVLLTSVKWLPCTTSCPNNEVNITASLKPKWEYVIQSPGFPSNYPLNKTCTWRVFFPDSMKNLYTNYRMFMRFEAKEIEPCTGCACDYLANGESERDVERAFSKRCGLYSQNAISYLKDKTSRLYVQSGSRDKELWLRFHSDHSSEFKGFKGKITVINDVTNRCTNHINDTSGSISSPKYPSKYLPSQTITWCIAVPKGFRVKLTFKSFDLENTRTSDNDCLNDFVEVRDGNQFYNGYGELLGRFCGNTIPSEIFSLSNQMWVMFASDYNATTVYKGFNAHFVSGGDLVKPSFTFAMVLALMGLVVKQFLY